MKTCRTCRWWKKWENISPFHETLGYIVRIRQNEDTTRTCQSPRLSGQMDCYGKLDDPSEATPGASDDRGLHFATGCDFGCIHHEDSEAEALRILELDKTACDGLRESSIPPRHTPDALELAYRAEAAAGRRLH